MKDRSKILYVGLGMIALVALFYWFNPSRRSKFDWRESWTKSAYSEASDQPYGTQVLHRLLDLLLLEKALYELRYELANRPDWAAIPLRGLAELAR